MQISFSKILDSLIDKNSNIYLTGVYKIYNEKHENVFYIGSTSISYNKYIYRNGFYNRWYTHLRSLIKNKHHSKYLQKVFNKYGSENFKFEIIEICEPEKCIEKEQYWIDFYKKSYKLYNTNEKANSVLGYKHTKESKLKISKSHKGKKLTEEHIFNRTNAQKGRKKKKYISPGKYKKIICIEDNLEFKCVTDAANYYKVCISSISSILKGKYKKLKNGKTFKYG